MKEIKAYVRQELIEAVVEALEQAGAPEVTIVRTEVAGADVRPEMVNVLRVPPLQRHPHLMKLELVCQDEEAERYAAVIRGVTGTNDHGHIAVSDVSVSD